MQSPNQRPYYPAPLTVRKNRLPLLIIGIVGFIFLALTLGAVYIGYVLLSDNPPPYPDLPPALALSSEQEKTIKKNFTLPISADVSTIPSAKLYKLDARRKASIISDFDAKFSRDGWKKEEIRGEIHYNRLEKTVIVVLAPPAQARILSYLPSQHVNALQSDEALLAVVLIYRDRI